MGAVFVANLGMVFGVVVVAVIFVNLGEGVFGVFGGGGVAKMGVMRVTGTILESNFPSPIQQVDIRIEVIVFMFHFDFNWVEVSLDNGGCLSCKMQVLQFNTFIHVDQMIHPILNFFLVARSSGGPPSHPLSTTSCGKVWACTE